jgi:hypothetical protein
MPSVEPLINPARRGGRLAQFLTGLGIPNARQNALGRVAGDGRLIGQASQRSG